MSDTSLLFSILARSNLSRVLAKDAAAVRAFTATLSGLGSGAAKLGKLGAVTAGAAGAAQSVIALTAALAPAAGIIAAIPAGAVLAAGALTTLKVATAGVGDAMGAALSGDAEEFAESLEGLAPAAQSVAREMRALSPEVDRLKQSVQQAMFRPLRGDLTAVAAVMLGPLRTGMSGVAAEFGAIGHSVAQVARQSQTVALVQGVFSTLRAEIAGAGASVTPLLSGMRDFIAATLPAFSGMGAAVGGVAATFGAFLSNAAASGQALSWIETAQTVLGQLGTVLGNVGAIFSAVFTAMEGAGGGVLTTLGNLTGMVAEFLASAQGQEALTAVFSALTAISAAALPIIQALLSAVGPLIPVVAQLAGQLAGVLGTAVLTLVQAISPLLPILGQVATQFIGALLPAVQPLIPILGQVAGVLAGVLGQGLTMLAGIITPLVPVIGQFVQTVGTALLSAMQQLAPALMPVVHAFMSLLPALSPIFPVLGQLVQALLPPLVSLVQAVAPVLAQVVLSFGQLLSAIVPILPPIAELVVAISPLLTMLAELVGWLLGKLVPVISTVIGWISQLASIIVGALSAAVSWLIANVPKAWEQVKAAVGRAVSAISGIIGWFGSLPGKIGGWFGRAKDAAVNAWNTLLSWIRGVPGRILSGLGNLGALLVGAGRNLVQGLVNGIRNMASAAVNAARGVVSDAVSSAKRLLGISSPSRVFTWIGNMTGKGLVKGLLGTVSEIKSASKKMSDTVLAAWKSKRISFKFASSLLTVIDRGNSRLQALAKQRESILKRIDDAKKFATSVAGNARAAAALSGMDFSGRPPSAAAIQSQLADKLSRIRRFADVVKQLAKRGINKTLLRQVIEAGPDEGLDLGMALLNANASMFGSINSAQSAIDTASDKLAIFSADALYDSGKQAGKGFLAGLLAQQKGIEAAMDKLAKTLVSRIRKALKIKSPSQVLAETGVMSGQGFIAGVLSTLTGAAMAGQRLAGAVTPTTRAPGVTSPYTTPGVGRGGEVTVRLVADGADSDMLRLMRKLVRVEGRGNVQIAFGRG